MKEKKPTAKRTPKAASVSKVKRPAQIEVWKCRDLKALVKEAIKKELKEHGVRDAKLAKRLETSIGDGIAYGTGGGGGGGIGIA